MSSFTPTNAASSGITLDRKALKAIARRSDRPGLVYLAQWVAGLAITGAGVWAALGTPWVWPAMFVHGDLNCGEGYRYRRADIGSPCTSIGTMLESDGSRYCSAGRVLH